MKQNIVKKAQNIIFEKKRKAERDFEEKMKPLYLDANFSSLQKDYTRLMIENAQKEANGEEKNEKREQELLAQISQLKKANNVGEIEYSCHLCNDKGILNGEYCKCLKKQISKIMLEDSGFESLADFKDCTFSNDTTKLFYHKMQQWCNSDFKKNLIYISGPTGVGKTHLIKCMAKQLLERGKILKIVTAYSLNQDLKQFLKTNNDDILKKYLEVEILFIDDLGTEPLLKNVTQQGLYLLINERKMRKLPTIITANLTLDEICDRYDERIYSRIADRQTSINFLLSGDDIRLKK